MMGALFKADDLPAQRAVRTFTAIKVPEWPISQAVEDRSELREARAEHEGEVDQNAAVIVSEADELRARLESVQRQLEETEKKAYQRGLEDGKALSTSREQERLDTLKAAAQHAQSQLDEQLEGLQALSLQFAQIALSKIFGNADQISDLVAASISHRCNQLSAELITGIRVSSEDFRNLEALDHLMQSTGRTDISVDARLASGECQIDLRLGQYDIGIGSQWSNLQTFLNELSLEELPG